MSEPRKRLDVLTSWQHYLDYDGGPAVLGDRTPAGVSVEEIGLVWGQTKESCEFAHKGNSGYTVSILKPGRDDSIIKTGERNPEKKEANDIEHKYQVFNTWRKEQ